MHVGCVWFYWRNPTVYKKYPYCSISFPFIYFPVLYPILQNTYLRACLFLLCSRTRYASTSITCFTLMKCDCLVCSVTHSFTQNWYLSKMKDQQTLSVLMMLSGRKNRLMTTHKAANTSERAQLSSKSLRRRYTTGKCSYYTLDRAFPSEWLRLLASPQCWLDGASSVSFLQIVIACLSYFVSHYS